MMSDKVLGWMGEGHTPPYFKSSRPSQESAQSFLYLLSLRKVPHDLRLEEDEEDWTLTATRRDSTSHDPGRRVVARGSEGDLAFLLGMVHAAWCYALDYHDLCHEVEK